MEVAKKKTQPFDDVFLIATVKLTTEHVTFRGVAHEYDDLYIFLRRACLVHGSIYATIDPVRIMAIASLAIHSFCSENR